MRTGWRFISGLLALGVAFAGDHPDTRAEFFEMRIRPLFGKNCFACHTAAKLGGLQLDSREHILKGGNSGPAIQPGNPEQSLLIQAVTGTHARIKMPPTGKLTDREVGDLTEWVRLGAVWPETHQPTVTAAGGYVITKEQRAFWAFQPVSNPPVPKPRDLSWVKSPIDAFILAKLEPKGMKPAGAADKRVLIRRATFDLIGLPPTPEEVTAFLADPALNAFEKVVDRLLASPHYGERWGRYWLDVARYADGRLDGAKDTPKTNDFRYRDWVIQAFNDDLPYDVFAKAQIAADYMPEPQRERLLPGLDFQTLSTTTDDQVDVTAKAFLGLTVGCAQCHDHKFDPIPTRDYYSLLGVFKSSKESEYPLADPKVVEAYKKHEQKIADVRDNLDDFYEKQSRMLSEALASKTAKYVMAAWKVLGPSKLGANDAAEGQGLDLETLERWIQYLKDPEKDHKYLQPWFDLLKRNAKESEIREFAQTLQQQAVDLIQEKKEMDDRSYVILGGFKGVRDVDSQLTHSVEHLPVQKYYFWRDLCGEAFSKSARKVQGVLYYYGPKQIRRFLNRDVNEYLDAREVELDQVKKSLPEHYPALNVLKDADKPGNIHVALRGDASNPGEEAPRRFLAILSQGEPKPFTKGSGRLELADAIANAQNPLFARVMVNRIWQRHFVYGLVRTPNNFGQLGERPSHPELLDWLASRFAQNGWSVKKLHRDIMLSSAYRMSAANDLRNAELDAENRLLWRANIVPRLDVESLRDSLLFVAGKLDLKVGGESAFLDDKNHRRTVYALVSRNKLDSFLKLFDYPDPSNSTDRRAVTNGPLQRLFFMNSPFVEEQAKALVERLGSATFLDDAAKVTRMYQVLYGRAPDKAEVQAALDFLKPGKSAWPEYAQVLLNTNEFLSVN